MKKIELGRRLRFAWLSAVDLVFDAVIGGLWFIVSLVLLALSVALLPVFGLGLVPLMLLGYVNRLAGTVERRRAEAIYEITIPPPPRVATSRTGWIQPFAQALVNLTDPTLWRTLAHHAVTLLMAIGLTWAIRGFESGLVPATHRWGLGGGIGLLIIALIVLAVYCYFIGRLDARVVSTLLGARATDQLHEEVRHLSDARAGALDAAAHERARIERNLHDGIQPGLVSVAMTLDMARRAMDTDPAAAEELLGQAHQQAKSNITELRQLVRGFRPAVLEDRGLDAALSAIAARCAVPTTVAVDLPVRLSPPTEAVIYFVVAEALTNVDKHSGASRAEVRILSETDSAGRCRVLATVRDDGHGGAAIGTGLGRGGLANMRDRVRAVSGTLHIDSPPAGPSLISVEVPCEL